jgi:hypothetical protein
VSTQSIKVVHTCMSPHHRANVGVATKSTFRRAAAGASEVTGAHMPWCHGGRARVRTRRACVCAVRARVRCVVAKEGRGFKTKEGGTDAHCGFEAIPHGSATRCSHRPQAVAVTAQRCGQRALPAERNTHRHGHGCQRVWEGEVGPSQSNEPTRVSAKDPKAFAQWGSARPRPSPSSIHVSWSRQ